MTFWSLISFAAVISIAAAMPGPTIVTLVARVLARGAAGVAPLVAGLILGDLVWLTCSVFGAVALAAGAHQVMVVLKYAGAAYLAFLAVKMWTSPATAADGNAPAAATGSNWRAVFGGLSIGLSNPKTMLFYLALVPNLIDVSSLSLGGFAELCAIVIPALMLVFGGYVILAARARGLFRSAKAMRLINRGSGAVIAGTAVVVATRH